MRMAQLHPGGDTQRNSLKRMGATSFAKVGLAFTFTALSALPLGKRRKPAAKTASTASEEETALVICESPEEIRRVDSATHLRRRGLGIDHQSLNHSSVLSYHQPVHYREL